MSLFIDLAIRVLQSSGHAMSAKGIWAYADSNGMVSDKISGATPIQTLKSKLSVHIRRHGEASPFVRTGPGRFFLRSLIRDKKTVYDAPKLVPAGISESVLVFPQKLLDDLGRFQGITKAKKAARLLSSIAGFRECVYKPRLEAETDNNYKQVVTYVLIKTKTHVLAFRRGNYTLSDKLLRGAECIGFGGHVTDQDGTLFNPDDSGIRDSAVREISEEIKIRREETNFILGPSGLQLIGALNDDSSDVGKRHFAFIFSYTPPDLKYWHPPLKNEKAITNLRWIDTRSTGFSIARFEYWSQLCLRAYFPSFLRLQPEFVIRRKPKSVNPVLCIIGPIGSGKTEATSVFTSDHGFEEINSGRVVADILGLPPVPKTPREEFQPKAAAFIKAKGGPKRLAEEIVRRVQGEKVLIDGVRHEATLSELSAILKNHSRCLLIMYVHTPFDLALSFYQKRENRKISADEFLKLRTSESEKQVGQLINKADVIIYNWIGRDNYRGLIRKLMRKLGFR